MKDWAYAIVVRLYRVLLAFYPHDFRSAFGTEMQDDFQESLFEIQQSGRERIGRLLWRELSHWPGSVLREYLRARRKTMSINGYVDEKPLQPNELLASMMLFLLPMVSILLTTGVSLPNWTNILLVLFFWGCIIFAVGLAISKRLPRWSLSYLGVLLMIGLVLGQFDRAWTWIYPYFLQSFGPRSMWPLGIRIVYSSGGAFSMIFSILLSALALVGVLGLFPFTRKIWYRIRSDWTQLSFLIYGSLVFFISIAFEEFQYDEISKLAAWIFLALGAWKYLRSGEKKQRILGLIGGATGAMWVVAISYWILIPLQNWQDRYSLISMNDLRWTDTSTAIIGWICILLVIIAPALLNLLPLHNDSTRQNEATTS